MRDTYKYHFKVGNLIVHPGVTERPLSERKREHQNSGSYTTYNNKRYYWKHGHIVQVGNMTTWEAALKWERNEYLRLGL